MIHRQHSQQNYPTNLKDTMTQNLQQQPQNHSNDYLTGLLEKNPKASSRAHQYVTLKNVQISERLVSGEQLIAISQTEIKILKNISEQERKKLKQKLPEKDSQQRKVLLIDGQSSRIMQEQQSKSPPKEISEQERLKFVKQKIRENKVIAKRKEQQMKKLEQKQKQNKQQQLQQQLKKSEEVKQKRVEETKKKLGEMEKRKQQRVIENQKTNEILKEKSKEKTLADKIHENFLSNQNLMLDEKKKKLAEIRQLYKPIDKKELDEHMKKFQESRLQRSRNKSSHPKSINTSSQKMNQYYRSMFHQILEKEKKQKEQEQVEHGYKVKELKDRGKKYAEEIKVNFRPEIDLKKRDEIEKRIKSSSLIGVGNANGENNKMKGMEYLEFTKEYGQKFKKEQNPLDQATESKLLIRQQANKTQHTDYLAQVRKTNQSRLKRSATSTDDFIRRVEKKNLSTKQKQEQIIQYAQDLERKAREKEKIMKIGYAENVDEEVDKLYISAIQAKIKALQV